MSYGLSLLGFGFRNEDDDKSDQKIKEERNVFRLHWEVNVFKIDFQGMKGPNTKYCLTSKVITTIYALHFSLLVLLSLFFFFFDDLSSFVALVFYRDRVLVGEGVRFEVYLREERVLKGSFWRDYGDEWRLDCKCVLENETARAEEEA